jgi:hypothetical protein
VLASVPQLAELRVRFYSGFGHQLRTGHYEFLRVEYPNNARPSQEWPISDLYGRSEPGRWEIVVQPVPRTLRHRVKQYILDSPPMRDQNRKRWKELCEQAATEQDPEKLLELTAEIDRLLSEKYDPLEGKTSDKPKT